MFDHSNESYLAVPSLGTTCFLSFSQNEILKIVLHFDFCYFWRKDEDFLIRGVVDMIVVKNSLFFFFGLSW